MNKNELLILLVKDAEAYGANKYEYARDYGLEESLRELNRGARDHPAATSDRR